MLLFLSMPQVIEQSLFLFLLQLVEFLTSSAAAAALTAAELEKAMAAPRSSSFFNDMPKGKIVSTKAQVLINYSIYCSMPAQNGKG